MRILHLMLLLPSLSALPSLSSYFDNLIPPDGLTAGFHRKTRRALERENEELKERIAALELQASVAPVNTSQIAKQRHAPSGNADTVLSCARLEAIGGSKRQVILSFVNTARLDFAATWAAHMRRLGLTNWLIGATDSEALRRLLDANTPCVDLHTQLSGAEWAWGSGQFHTLGPTKVALIKTVLGCGFELVITDIDALVLREPFAFVARWPDASFLTTSDHLANTTNEDDGLETNRAGSAYNIGYMFFRPAAQPLVVEWLRSVLADPTGTWDQGEFNRLARQKQKFYSERNFAQSGLSDIRLFRSFDEKIIGGVLPLTLFCGGHNYFASRLPQRRGLEPYSVHTTFQYGGADGKRHRLREAMIWEDEPSYYDPPGGLLRYEPDIPASLLHPPGGMSAQAHIDLVEHQLKQLGAAFALAFALRRMLILPKLVCGYDKASEVTAPLVCPPLDPVHTCCQSHLCWPLGWQLCWPCLCYCSCHPLPPAFGRRGLLSTVRAPSRVLPPGLYPSTSARSTMCLSPIYSNRCRRCVSTRFFQTSGWRRPSSPPRPRLASSAPTPRGSSRALQRSIPTSRCSQSPISQQSRSRAAALRAACTGLASCMISTGSGWNTRAFTL